MCCFAGDTFLAASKAGKAADSPIPTVFGRSRRRILQALKKSNNCFNQNCKYFYVQKLTKSAASGYADPALASRSSGVAMRPPAHKWRAVE